MTQASAPQGPATATAFRALAPSTALFPVPLVLVTSGTADAPNVFINNRIASVAAEPPVIAMGVRPARHSSRLIWEQREFVVALPTPDMLELVNDLGTTTGKDEDKWHWAGLTRLPATHVAPPLIAECPVNIECRVRHILDIGSHDLFVADVLAVHAWESVLDGRGEIQLDLAGGGLSYASAIVREKPAEDDWQPRRRRLRQA